MQSSEIPTDIISISAQLLPKDWDGNLWVLQKRTQIINKISRRDVSVSKSFGHLLNGKGGRLLYLGERLLELFSFQTGYAIDSEEEAYIFP
jgi:hypothetical protein